MKETRDILVLFEALNNHEIFTPPKLAKEMLNQLPEEVWTNPSLKFLDPCTKSGIFLREIFYRLYEGLKDKGVHKAHDGLDYDLSNDQERINHILKNMIYGIATSELTGYVARRTLYGVMEANTDKQLAALESFTKSENYHQWSEEEQLKFVGRNKFNEYYDHNMFNTKEYKGFEEEGNIFYPANEVAKKVLEDGNYEVEDTYYPFINDETRHQKILDIKEGKMKFDVIIGNPPYQISDGGNSRSAKPIYHLFVKSAKEISSKHVVMITPSRWFVGGKGLDSFRKEMLKDEQIRTIVDFRNVSEVFPGVDIAGGVSYFHWEKKSKGETTFINSDKGIEDETKRYLGNYPILIRSNKAVSIISKIKKNHGDGKYLSEVVSARKPFGLPTNYKPVQSGDQTQCWFVQKIGLKYAKTQDIDNSKGFLHTWNLLIPKAPIAGQTDFSKPVKFYYSGNTRISEPGQACTESWLVACSFKTKAEVESFKSYLFTKTVRFLLLQAVISQDITRQNFCFVPNQPSYDKKFTDDYLRDLWEITNEEWEVISERIQDTE